MAVQKVIQISAIYSNMNEILHEIFRVISRFHVISRNSDYLWYSVDCAVLYSYMYEYSTYSTVWVEWWRVRTIYKHSWGAGVTKPKMTGEKGGKCKLYSSRM